MRSIAEEQFQAWGEGLRRSDRAVFTAVFDAAYDALFRYACYITQDQEAAYDLVQEVFLKLWLVRETINPARSLRALLYQMVRNAALNHERDRKRHSLDPLTDTVANLAAPPETEENIDARALQEHLEVWIAEMPERRREAFVLSRFEGLSHEEIAGLMDLTPKTVNNHIVLALQHLRRRLHTLESDLRP
jgi:RNA polymerase sigma-70 factor (ECF subfamily)